MTSEIKEEYTHETMAMTLLRVMKLHLVHLREQRNAIEEEIRFIEEQIDGATATKWLIDKRHQS